MMRGKKKELLPDSSQTNMSAQNSRLVRSALTMTIPTILSRLLGYARDMIQAKFMGTGMGMDAFTIASLIPNLLRRLTGEGAMMSAFIPVFTQVKKEKKREELWSFANAFFYDMTLLMAVLTLAGILLSPLLVKVVAFGYMKVPGKEALTVLLTRIMFPYLFLISLAALAMAILNSFHKFFIPSFTPVLFNAAIIGMALLFGQKSREPSLVFAVGVIIGGALQLGIQIPSLWRKGMRFKFGLSFTHPAIRKVARLMVPGIVGAGIYQINMMVSRMIATSLEEGSVSSLYYSSRVQELTLGLFSVALSVALLPTLSDLAALKDIEGMKKTLNFSFKLVFLVTFPAMAGLAVLNKPIVQVLFQRGVFDEQSTAMTSGCLFFFAFGLPFISGVRILAPMFYSLKDTKTPVIAAVFVMLSYVGLSLIMMSPFRVGGIALALSLSSLLNFILLFILLEKKIGRIEKKSLVISSLKSALSAAAMAGVLWVFMSRIEFKEFAFSRQIAILAAGVLGGILVYLIMNLLFRHEDLKNLKEIFSREKIIEG